VSKDTITMSRPIIDDICFLFYFRDIGPYETKSDLKLVLNDSLY